MRIASAEVSFGVELEEVSEVGFDSDDEVELDFGFGLAVENTLSSSGDAVGINLFCSIKAER